MWGKEKKIVEFWRLGCAASQGLCAQRLRCAWGDLLLRSPVARAKGEKREGGVEEEEWDGGSEIGDLKFEIGEFRREAERVGAGLERGGEGGERRGDRSLRSRLVLGVRGSSWRWGRWVGWE